MRELLSNVTKRFPTSPEAKKWQRETVRKYREKNPEKYLLYSARERAYKAGIEFDLEESDIDIPKLCPIFGTPLQMAAGRVDDASPTLDRIDNSRGYVRGNVWVISWRANRLKSDATLDELRLIVRALERVEKRSSSRPSP